MRAHLNRRVRPDAVQPPEAQAAAYHAGLAAYEPTPLHQLAAVAAQYDLGWVGVKDESLRLGLPAFKILGASWAVERALRARADVHTLVAASAGNHGRAVAHVAASRGLRCRVLLPARAAAARREAIAAEGAEVVVVEGDYEDAVALAAREGAGAGTLEVTDVGAGATASWVIDGYATLFAEAAAQASFDLLVVPVGVGSLAAAAARFAASTAITVIGVEPANASCLTASLAAGQSVAVETPGTLMAGLDCAEVSAAAWPSLRDGVHGTIAVGEEEAGTAVRELAAAGLAVGHSGAAPLAALKALATDQRCSELRDFVRLGAGSRVLLVATEGPTDPEAYARTLAG